MIGRFRGFFAKEGEEQNRQEGAGTGGNEPKAFVVDELGAGEHQDLGNGAGDQAAGEIAEPADAR